MKKPLKTCGGYITDGNFKALLFTKNQVTLLARDKLKSAKRYGCNNFKVIEKDDYFCISMW